MPLSILAFTIQNMYSIDFLFNKYISLTLIAVDDIIKKSKNNPKKVTRRVSFHLYTHWSEELLQKCLN